MLICFQFLKAYDVPYWQFLGTIILLYVSFITSKERVVYLPQMALISFIICLLQYNSFYASMIYKILEVLGGLIGFTRILYIDIAHIDNYLMKIHGHYLLFTMVVIFLVSKIFIANIIASTPSSELLIELDTSLIALIMGFLQGQTLCFLYRYKTQQ